MRFQSPSHRTALCIAAVLFAYACGEDSRVGSPQTLDASSAQDAAVEDGDLAPDSSTDGNTMDGDTPDGGIGAPTLALESLKAFPSAFGIGERDIEGGRDGRAFFVDTLAIDDSSSLDAETDSYAGTFRAAMRMPECLTIYFRVAGVIDYSSAPLLLYDSDGCKTIVGASAPRPGIVIFGARVSNGSGATLFGNTIVRGITILIGSSGIENTSTAFSYRSGNVVVSDSTLGWAGDEAIGVSGGNAIVQRNLFIEGFPGHDTGGIIGAVSRAGTESMSASQHNNVFYSNHRFLNARGDARDVIDIVNNVAYYDGTRLNSHNCDLRLNDVNNYWVSRDNSRSIEHAHKWNASTSDNTDCDDSPLFFASGNELRRVDGTILFDGPGGDDERTMYRQHIDANGYVAGDPLPDGWFTNTPHPYGGGLGGILRTAEATATYLVTEKHVGARRYTDEHGISQRYIIPRIDAYLSDIAGSTTSAFLEDESRFSIDELALPLSENPYVDEDRDGMPDTFEEVHGLDATDHSDAILVQQRWDFGAFVVLNDAGYTNREICSEWMHGGFELLLDYQSEGLSF